MKRSKFGLIAVLIEIFFVKLGLLLVFLISFNDIINYLDYIDKYGHAPDLNSSLILPILIIVFEVMLVLSLFFSLMAYINNDHRFAVAAFLLSLFPMLMIIPLVGIIGVVFVWYSVYDIGRINEENMLRAVYKDYH